MWTERSSLRKAPGEDGKIVQGGKRAEEHESEEFGERSDWGGAGEPVDLCLSALSD